MSKSAFYDDRQLSLDFNAQPILVENTHSKNSNVISIMVSTKARNLHFQPPPVINRLLKEAQNLRW